jgi:hypothetical protein
MVGARTSLLTRQRATTGLAFLALLLVSCAPREKDAASIDSSAAASTTAVTSSTAQFSVSDFARLRWIEGDWRGALPKGGFFYERYQFVDDSTIAMHGYDDANFSRVSDSATIVLRNGAVVDIGASAQWRASRLDENNIDFSPGAGASNRFLWTRESADRWTATIRAANGKLTVYRMERVPGK